MSQSISLEDISIRNEFKPGDMGYIIYLHGKLYHEEYNFGVMFEPYVAEGLIKLYNNYDPSLDKIWICEHNGRMVGTVFLVHIDMETTRLRYFLIDPEYRGIGLGKKLMSLSMDYFDKSTYTICDLWTTQELRTAISLYKRFGFKLAEEKETTTFGKAVCEQKYVLMKSALSQS